MKKEKLMPEDVEEQKTTPIWLEKDGKRVPAVIRSGPYIGTDGRKYYTDGWVYGLDSGVCYQTFGECYPFGTTIGAEPLHYILKGAKISLREAKVTRQ